MKNRVFRARLAALPMALATMVPVASIAETPRANLTLKEVVVTATRVAQPVTDLVADVSIIDEHDIARSGSQGLTQLLSSQAGLQTIGFGDASRIYVRGADSRMTALFVDGIRIDSHDGSSLMGGGVPWELVPLSQIERIEILRGPASAVYGSDAMGGVVQIFTKSGQAELLPYVDTSVGSNSTTRTRAGLSGKKDGFSYAIGLSYEDTLGFNTRPDQNHSPDHEPSTQKSAIIKLGYQPNARHGLEFLSLDSQRDYQYVPWNGGQDYRAHSALSASSLKWSAAWSDRYATKVMLATSTVAKRDDAPYDFRTIKQDATIESVLKQFGGGTLTAVLEHKSDSFVSDVSPYDAPFSGGRTNNAVGVGYGTILGSHGLQVNARMDQDDLYGSHGTGAIAYSFVVAPGWRATTSTGSAFRSPTLEQTFGPYGATDLRPETNQSVDFGLNFTGSDSTLQAKFFRNSIKNMISSSAALTTCDALSFCYYNVGEALIKGITLSGTSRLGSLNLRTSLDLLDPRDEINGRQLSLRARRVLSTGVSGQHEGWNWGVDLLGVGERFDDAANTKVLAGYGLINLSGSRSLGRDWTVTARVDNVGNRKYEEVGNYATPGRMFQVGIKWQPKN